MKLLTVTLARLAQIDPSSGAKARAGSTNSVPYGEPAGRPRSSKRGIHRWRTLGLVLGALGLSALVASAQTEEAVRPPTELKKLSLEELFDIEVTSVSKKPEKLSKTAAAVHVVTDEDIRRLGAVSIPEALRDIPGVEVARVDSRQYAITVRGFNNTTANKLLVLMDGRSLYTPLYSGVFWDVQDTLMEDIAQIEVIRGPGATVWGANAVNGVVNIITKSAEQTQGLLVTGGGGNEERGFTGVRYGGQLGPNAYFRVYGKYFDRDGSVRPNGQNADDRFRMGQGGFRVDWKSQTDQVFTLQSDVYDGSVAQPTAGDIDLKGGNILGRWTKRFSASSDLQIQAYYDRTDRNIPPIFGEKLDTLDLDIRHRFPLASGHDVVWGLGYRYTNDHVDNSSALAFLPSHLTRQLATAFVQDEVTLVENRLHLALGSKFEHNDYTGFEYEPSGRLAWTPSREQTVWGAISRAVRAPSRIDREFFAPGQPPYLLAGGPNFQSETVYAFEAGYRVQPTPTLTASAATFYNVYKDLRSLESGPPLTFANGLEGKSYGVELEASYQPAARWRLNTGYTFFHLSLRRRPGSTDTTSERQEGDSPRHAAFLESRLDLSRDIELDATIRYVDALPNQSVPRYVAFDARLGWRPSKNLEISIVGSNLSDPRHPEFGTPTARREIRRGVYGKAVCRF
ncbi:MAG: TonB-dependent receptor [Thermoplasmata archaeon]|nr:TonB-dependent receptor [Thermoplasmata archaeon]